MWEKIDYIIECIKNSETKTEVLKKLKLKNNGGNYNTLTSFISENNVDTSHFIPKKFSGRIVNQLSMEEILTVNSKFKNTSYLKEKLYKLGIKNRMCEMCGQGEDWKGKKMSLILDHINGVRSDNRLENLRIVCPNCNATLETHCRGIRRKNKRVYKYNYDKCQCGQNKRLDSESCRKCRFKNGSINKSTKRKVDRPKYETLIDQVNSLGYIGTSKIYGVSDNTIRKWIRMYEKYGLDY